MIIIESEKNIETGQVVFKEIQIGYDLKQAIQLWKKALDLAIFPNIGSCRRISRFDDYVRQRN